MTSEKGWSLGIKDRAINTKLKKQTSAYFFIFAQLSNEQKINPSFGDKDFVPRLGIFCSNSTAIAKKNNDVLGQKIIGEMMELLFTRYLIRENEVVD